MLHSPFPAAPCHALVTFPGGDRGGSGERASAALDAVLIGQEGQQLAAHVVLLVPQLAYDVFRREITIKGPFAEIDSFPAAVAALRSGRARTAGLITHRFKLDEYADALDALRNDRTVHKIIIECCPRAR